MTRSELMKRYFEWMCRLVCADRNQQGLSYRRLLHFLNTVPFEYDIPMDGNRAEDGINLRYQFGRENAYPDSMIGTYLDDHSCSVLEMMIALSIRCERYTMDDPMMGDRTGDWFWNMIGSLGLSSMNDDRYDEEYSSEVVDRFLRRDYGRNGDGGLFTIQNSTIDIRSVEIWYQMCMYLENIL